MRTGTRENVEPTCPFCGTPLERPKAMTVSALETALGGTCKCGAFYLVDPTSKNVGEVMMQALGLAAERLGRDMSELVAGKDYEDAVLSYDVRIHRSTGISRGFKDGQGRMYVMKVKG